MHTVKSTNLKRTNKTDITLNITLLVQQVVIIIVLIRADLKGEWQRGQHL